MGRPEPLHSLADWLGWLETLSPTEINLGLERVIEVLQRMPNRCSPRVIHVAGTNGKGSSAAMLEALYLQRDDSVACYTSPHVQRYNERIRIAGKDVDDAQIIAAFERVEAARQELVLTYFEFGTLAAVNIFDVAASETVILEIGLGGRLDAVNAIEPVGGIITNISVDHVAWLGSDINAIAREKAGIMRGGKPFVFASDNVPRAIIDVANDVGAELLVLDRDYRYSMDDNGRWEFIGRDCHIAGLHLPSLHGAMQLQNAAGVLALVEALGDVDLLNAATINAAFADLQLPGRYQRIVTDRSWILDVAHNRGAAEALAKSLQADPPGESLTCIVGILDDKDVDDIVGTLLPFVENWLAVTAASPRALPANKLAAAVANLSGKPCTIFDSIEDACIHAENKGAETVLVTGSFFVVGPALAWLSAAVRS